MVKKIPLMTAGSDSEKRVAEKTVKFLEKTSKMDENNLGKYNYFIMKMRAPKKPIDYKAYGSRMYSIIDK